MDYHPDFFKCQLQIVCFLWLQNFSEGHLCGKIDFVGAIWSQPHPPSSPTPPQKKDRSNIMALQYFKKHVLIKSNGRSYLDSPLSSDPKVTVILLIHSLIIFLCTLFFKTVKCNSCENISCYFCSLLVLFISTTRLPSRCGVPIQN